jgi:hypothetical protein
MSRSGFVYVLLNPSLPDLVKIGKTTGLPEERAKQLSTTGIPSKFIVAYQRQFTDCDIAEAAVHTILASKGFRISPNREFFSAPITVAIDAIQAVKEGFSESNCVEGEPSPTLEPLTELITELLRDAENARYGFDGEIKDATLAYRLYEKAAKLGASEAFVALADLAESQTDGMGSQSRALEWLREGTRRGAIWCWVELADVYIGRKWGNPPDPNDARKCYRKFFNSVIIADLDDDQERQVFFRLKEYFQWCRFAIEPQPEDRKAALNAAAGLLEVVNQRTDVVERDARRAAIEALFTPNTARDSIRDLPANNERSQSAGLPLRTTILNWFAKL